MSYFKKKIGSTKNDKEEPRNKKSKSEASPRRYNEEVIDVDSIGLNTNLYSPLDFSNNYLTTTSTKKTSVQPTNTWEYSEKHNTNTDIVYTLEHHYLNDVFEFNDSLECFFATYRNKDGQMAKKRVKGLVPFLRSIFWPTYEYVENPYHEGTGAHGEGGGKKRGLTIHSEMQEYTLRRHVYEPNRYLENFFHPYTVDLIDAFRYDWKWTPVLSEFKVYDRELGVATRVDCIVREEETGDYHCVEFKTGMDGYLMIGCSLMFNWFDKDTLRDVMALLKFGDTSISGDIKRRATLQSVLGDIDDSPLNQALLQSLFCKVFLEKYYGVKIKNAYVVNINQENVSRYKNETLEAMSETLYAHAMITNREIITAKNNEKSLNTSLRNQKRSDQKKFI